MSRSFPSQNAQKTERRRRTSQAMERNAASRQCPECERKGAIKTQVDGEFILRYCRYDDCSYEQGRYV